jgi:segregation and condensation protein A
MSHAVKIEVFEGPIDLLLHLITRQRVDIYEVPLASIAGEYLAAVQAMPELDLESATGFLVVASALLELKSARLLPGHVAEREGEGWVEERDLLLFKLVEVATFREAGAWLAARLEEGERWHPREVALEEAFASPPTDPAEPIPLSAVVASAAQVLAPRRDREIDTTHVAPIVASVRDAVMDVATELQGRGSVSFRELCRSATDRIAIVVRFLALLELFKAGAVELSQAERFGEIGARWTGEVDAHVVVSQAEEYAAE